MTVRHASVGGKVEGQFGVTVRHASATNEPIAAGSDPMPDAEMTLSHAAGMLAGRKGGMLADA